MIKSAINFDKNSENLTTGSGKFKAHKNPKQNGRWPNPCPIRITVAYVSTSSRDISVSTSIIDCIIFIVTPNNSSILLYLCSAISLYLQACQFYVHFSSFRFWILIHHPADFRLRSPVCKIPNPFFFSIGFVKFVAVRSFNLCIYFLFLSDIQSTFSF